jgi:hypothetical protein
LRLVERHKREKGGGPKGGRNSVGCFGVSEDRDEQSAAMNSMLPSKIVFEARDVEIFNIPDLKTRIATVQNYFFPRLEILLRRTCDLIQKIYGANPYERMTFVYHPSNRKTARQNLDFHEVSR